MCEGARFVTPRNNMGKILISRNLADSPAGGLLLLLFFLSGCGPKITVPAVTPAEVPALEELANYPHGNYHIEPGDKIRIEYPFHPEMKQEGTVRPDGKISATLVGEIDVAGRTTDEVEKMLEQRTSHRLRDPEVVVTVENFAPKSVYVSGEVGKPGNIPYRKGMTPLQAVIEAGGFLDTAMVEQVVLIRATGSGNEVVTRSLNLLQPVISGEKEPLKLAPRDIVYVPKTGIANANVWVQQHIVDLFPVFKGVAVRPQ
jgi:polysaccharide biosynthesis/export protein PslD